MTPRLVPPASVTADELSGLRTQVRDFLHEQIATGTFTPGVDTWLTRWDSDFSRALADRGWIGMTIPVEYGGHGRSFVERFVVTEELLAAGAPVAAHWVADRQAAPSLLTFGTEEQKQRFLPGIARGEISWAIGMSEPESGSDLASVRTRATRVDGGWRIDGTKLWTSGAHRADGFFCLARSAPLDPAGRHEGLSQFIVLLDSPGVHIRPIHTMAGDHHFNEVLLDGVFVPDASVLGRIGDGWHQVTSELGFERSGPERFLSTFALLGAAVDEIAARRLPSDAGIGRLVGRMYGMHQMSLAVAGALARGENADLAASVVKVLGTESEGDVVELVDELHGETWPGGERFDDLMHGGVMQRPGFTLRGGTTEILRGVVARGLGMR
ncbi:acyl-CoA dehydrogenase [Rhodococcus triatomae]|uniref:Acyl-CoA dehydrogenase n=1 Tax=Rhodococcus triatomae TaxID=300028 RepID=A0A1G8QLF0_9NOCA|nr:acyl-CoA dehydrogenase family protein [Rhodococcus triatomae]QNG20634.1 acyl-CoA dehydrogenase [Rhodococcus triatomae]QNG23448.1 acyl-CoA dehydrogenase [Rhodococcus triatomae]SDJ05582.1 Acyl-CoA dehydrogenase [Rhodococcus triatomae]